MRLDQAKETVDMLISEEEEAVRQIYLTAPNKLQVPRVEARGWRFIDMGEEFGFEEFGHEWESDRFYMDVIPNQGKLIVDIREKE